MRISELSRASELPLATVKFYLREGLLPAGTATAPNQAAYDDRHVRRLRLIRTLAEVGGLGVDRMRAVLSEIDDPRRSVHDMLGAVHDALGPHQAPGPTPELRDARQHVDQLIHRMRWTVRDRAPARDDLGRALVALHRLSWPVAPGALEMYARAADGIADREIAGLDATTPRAQLAEQVVIGTVIFEQVLVALRRLAQEHRSAVRFKPATKLSARWRRRAK